MSTEMWKLEKDLCRCCHAEGSFKNLSEPSFQLGQEEIYADMLHECLDVTIVPMTGSLGDVTYTICDSCVARLRDATNFKKQVLDCEERFKDMYSRNLIRGFEVKDEPILLSDSEDVKEEFQSMDDDDDAFLKFDDGDDDLAESDQSVEAEPPKSKGKGKAKPKPKPKAKAGKKTRGKRTIKEETNEDITEAAVSGEKKKGQSDSIEVCTISTEDGLEIFTCLECDRTFFTKENFAQHYKHIHLNMRPSRYPCPICQELVFPYKRAEHMEMKHNRPAPKCEICGKKFPHPHFVLRHQRVVHMGEKNYKCEQCGKAFPERRYLRRHALAHTDIRDYACDLCGKRFKWKKNLQIHVDIHMNVRRHVCEFCGQTFVQLSSLRYHMESRHPEERNQKRT